MEFEEAYNLVIDRWPTEIDISDVTFHSSGGATIPELVKAHDEVEAKLLSSGRQVLAMDWSVFQYLHAEAKKLHKESVYLLKTHNIDLAKLKGLYLENCQ